MSKEKKNIVASVLARLRNTSKSGGTPFQQVLQMYAMERFLHRISKSKHAQSVILKGALLLNTIGIPGARPTMDIDMLRTGNADQGSLLALVKDCATLDVEADGLTFFADSTVAEEITKDSEYKGTRILVDARMDNVRLKVQIDFGVAGVCRFLNIASFVKKMGEAHLADTFGKVVEDLRDFALPVLRSLASGEKLTQQWKAGTGWVAS